MNTDTDRQARPAIRLDIRPATDDDTHYVLQSWCRSWKRSARCKRLSDRDYQPIFHSLVRQGVLAQPDTKVLIGAAEQDSSWIWSWLCYTPGLVPTVHYGIVRNVIHDDEGPIRLRRLGIFTRLLAAAGVTSELVYTFQPADHWIEPELVLAAKDAGVMVRFRPVDEFLKMRRD